MSSRSSAVRGATRPPTSISAMRRTSCATRVRLDLFLRPAQSTLTFRNNDQPDGAADPQFGSFLPGQRRRRRRRPLERRRPGASCRPISACAAISTERYGAGFIPHDCRSRTGASPTTSWSRTTTSSNISPASPARPAISTASSRPAATRSKGRARANIRCRR